MATKTLKVPNETNEERARREEAERYGKDLIDSLETSVNDEDVIEARIDESEEDREKRRLQHVSDERMLADLGRVREIADSLERDRTNYLARLDNAIRRLRGLAGNPNPTVRDAVMAVAKRHDLEVSPKGLTQPKPAAKPGHVTYPFAE